MLRVTSRVAVLVAFTVFLAPADDGEKNRKRAERRLLNLENRAKKIPAPATADDLSGFLQSETGRLINRSRTLPLASYEFERMLEAVDDLLDAREDLSAAGRDAREKDDESRGDTARHLERAYFRVQQADYFGGLSADKHASEYVLRSRELYQKGRAAYDTRDFRRANKLASASSELVNVLENLAQAAVRKRDPPVLK